MPEEATGTSLRPQLARKRVIELAPNLLSEFRGRSGDYCLVIARLPYPSTENQRTSTTRGICWRFVIAFARRQSK